MPSKLTYFQIRGLGELVRISLNDLGVEYEDSYPAPDWPTFKKENTDNGKLTFGQLPLFEDEDGAIVQSAAILRHLGRKYKAYGATEAEMIKVDVAVEGASDWRRNYSKVVYTDNLEDEPLQDKVKTNLTHEVLCL